MPESILHVIIRDAVDPADLDAVRGLLAIYRDEFGPTVRENLRLQGFDAELAGLPGRYAGPSGALLLATVDARPAGCVALRDLGDGVCEMKRLYIDPSARSLGLGKRLVAAVLDRARALGYRRMVLDSTPEMSRAVALYRSFGVQDAEPYGESSHALFFAKDLV
ncbi:MAG: hypothetical protein BGO49_06515 [Planctomycetales bacterium 71-10]|nr:MAG: hypothetical protein BGO49_06515 [Planctomycetales bacterium 71-10]